MFINDLFITTDQIFIEGDSIRILPSLQAQKWFVENPKKTQIFSDSFSKKVQFLLLDNYAKEKIKYAFNSELAKIFDKYIIEETRFEIE